jgi:epsilon-lactone hydrolase
MSASNKSKSKTAFFFIALFAVYGWVFCLMMLIDSGWYAYLVLCAVGAMLAIVRTTKLWHGWRIFACWLLAVCLAYAGLIFGRPDLQVSFAGTLTRESIRFVMQMPALQDGGLFSKGSEYASRESKWKAPSGYSNEKFSLSASGLEILQNNAQANDNIIYQLHGGGYVIGFMDVYRNMAVRYSKISGGADVASLDYRIVPDNTYPAALDDAVEGWEFLLAKGYKPENIIIAGDSAGGNLTLALVAKLRDEGKELPKAVICMSPWADLAGKGESHTTNIYKDPLFGIKEGTAISDNFVPPTYAGNTDLTDKYLSPLYGSFSGFPPMLIQVGTYEILESDSLSVFEKAKAAGVDVKLTRYNGMFHVFQMAGNMMPESKAAWAEVSAFLTEQYNK